MSAQMLIAMCQAPVYRQKQIPTPETKIGSMTIYHPAADLAVTDLDTLMARVREPRWIEAARNLLLEDDGNQYGLELLSQDVIETFEQGPELEGDSAPRVTDDIVAQCLQKIISQYVIQYDSSVVWVRPENRWYLATGGMSHGDAPSESASSIWFLDELGIFAEPFENNLAPASTAS